MSKIASEDALTGKYFVAHDKTRFGIVDHRVRDGVYLVTYLNHPVGTKLMLVEQMLEWEFFDDVKGCEATFKARTGAA